MRYFEGIHKNEVKYPKTIFEPDYQKTSSCGSEPVKRQRNIGNGWAWLKAKNGMLVFAAFGRQTKGLICWNDRKFI